MQTAKAEKLAKGSCKKTMSIGQMVQTVNDFTERVTLDNNATVHGVVHSVRDMGGFAFIVLRLPDGYLQCVWTKDGGDEEKSILREEASVEITGRLIASDKARGGIELSAISAKLLSSPSEESPVQIGKRGLTIALEKEIPLRPVALRTARNRAVFKLQEGIVRGVRRFLEDSGFTEIFSPKIGAAGAEGGANIFQLEYFGRTACLAQSPQLYKQMLIPVYERVFEIAPVFRAEKHDTARHLNEYVSIDFEMGFIESFYDIIEMETAMLQSVFAYLKKHYSQYLSELAVELPEIDSIPCVRFRDIKELVSQEYKRKIRDPYDLEPEEERLISRYAKEKLGSDFVFVTHYPSKKRPFYAMDDPENPKFTLTFDLLFRGMEITTGGQRIHDYKTQVEKMRGRDIEPDSFESYLMLHKYGCPPHGGLGMGLERLLMMLLGEKNIRATTMFPRDTLRLEP